MSGVATSTDAGDRISDRRFGGGTKQTLLPKADVELNVGPLTIASIRPGAVI